MRKKILLIIGILALAFFVVACDQIVPEDHDPVISGAIDREITAGTQFVPLQDITASDEEDGDLTADVQYSGDVNPNVAGEYHATYTVTDSDGNIAIVTVTITVVAVDAEAPLLTGVGDLAILVGDPDFTILDGVAASDNVDGNVTSDIVTDGSVDVWVPGDYDVTYTVEDEAGNEASQVRTVTVGFGLFRFVEVNSLVNSGFDSDASSWVVNGATPSVASGVISIPISSASSMSQIAISGGFMNTTVADFSMLKVVINAKADVARSISIAISDTTTTSAPINLGTEYAEFTQYFRMSALLDNATLDIDLGSDAGTVDIDSIGLYFGSPSDDTAPVLTIPTSDIYAPVDNMVALETLVLSGVTAVDNIDGNITSSVMMDLTGIDITVPGEVDIPIVVSDEAGNESSETRTVFLNYMFDTGIIDDPTFDGPFDTNQWGLSGPAGTTTLDVVEGNLVLDVTTPGGWDSATSPYLRNVTTADLMAGNWYMFQFDVKAEEARQMRLRSGLELWSDPWIEDFMDGAVKNLQYQVTTEWQTIYYVFYVENAQSTDGSSVVKFEIKLGTITWGSEEIDNAVSIDNAQFYLLTMTDNAPTIHIVPEMQTTFVVGDTAPDWKTYITISDAEDGDITVTDEMVNATAVNMNAVGDYDVIYTVTDSAMNEVTETISFSIIASADVTAPVITIESGLPTSFDQGSSATVDLTAYITALDDVDGAIAITSAMIDDDGFDIDVAGEYTISYTVPDSSGNEATESVVLTVVDTEGPSITRAYDHILALGDTFDPLANIVAIDNVDGLVTLQMSDVVGYDDFLDGSNVVDVAGSFQMTYTVADALGNETIFAVDIEVVDLTFDSENEIDLLASQTAINNDNSGADPLVATGVYEVDGSLAVTYSGPSWWYASESKLKFLSLPLAQDQYYKLVIEAKADTARDVMLFLVGTGNQPIISVESFVAKQIIPLGTDYELIEIIFKPEISGAYNLELQFGWENYLNNVSAANVMYFKQFKILPVAGTAVDPVYMLDDMEYADQTAFDAVYVHRVPNAGANHNDAHLTLTDSVGFDGSKAVAFTLGGHDVTGWDLIRTSSNFDNTGLTDQYQYFGFWYKGDPVVTTLYVWLYWSTSQNNVTVDVSGVPSSGGFVTIPLSSWGHTATQITQYAIGYDQPSDDLDALIYLDDIMFVTDPSEVPVETPVTLSWSLDDFESYADTAALQTVYAHRISGANHNDSHVTLSTDGGASSSQALQFVLG